MSLSGWELTVLLCDYAQVSDGKLFIAGGGWSINGPGGFTHGLAMKLEVPWTEANRTHTLSCDLLDPDGKPVVVGDPPDRIRFETSFQVGRPVGIQEGSPLDFPLAVNLGPIHLPAGERFEWSVSVDGALLGRAGFQTRTI
ncbi:MAG: DUF6941 family protein [Actinomycetota bacterium]